MSSQGSAGLAPPAAVGDEHATVGGDILKREVAGHAQEQPVPTGEGHRVELLQRTLL